MIDARMMDYLEGTVSWSIHFRDEATYYEPVPEGESYVLRWYPTSAAGFCEVRGDSLLKVFAELENYISRQDLG